MDDAGFVRDLECLCNLLCDRDGLIDGNRALCDPIREGWPLDQLHDQCTDTVCILEAVDLRDVGMVQ